MVIQPNAWSVGSLVSTDPNAHSFHSPNWRHSGGRRSSQEVVAVEDDVVTIGSHPPYNLQAGAGNVALINAISFSQTQEGFLGKVEEALQRMGELSVMAQSEGNTDAERSDYASEFTQLQNRIKEIETKMSKAVILFQTGDSEAATKANAAAEEASMTSFQTGPLNEYLEDSSNPEVTTIKNTRSASAAVGTIHSALQAIADMRAKVNVDIQRLNSSGLRLSALEDCPPSPDLRIRDGNVAEESTRFVRSDILVKSGTAMLAQANALPQSAYRLLR